MEEEFGGVTEDTFTTDVPYATIDGEDRIVGEIKSVVTIQALTNSVMYCNIYPTNTPLFSQTIFLWASLKQELIKKE